VLKGKWLCAMSLCEVNANSSALVELCITLGRAMYKRSDRFLASYGLTSSQYEILRVLSEEGATPLNRLGERLCCACSNVTGIVDRLERDGVVKRERSREDRRVILLDLTDKGREIWKSVPSGGCCGMWLDNVLDADERVELRRILEKLIATMG
jgi:MarR family transcriptional regulator, organic hydroperoxide resistance regulator